MKGGINGILNQNKEVKNLIKTDIEFFDLYLDNLPRSDVSEYWDKLKKTYNPYFVWAIILKKYESFSDQNIDKDTFYRLVRSIKSGLKNQIYIKWTAYGKNTRIINDKLIYSIISYFLGFIKINSLQYKDVYTALKNTDVTKIQLLNNLKENDNLKQNKDHKEFVQNSGDVDFIDNEKTFAVIDGEVVPPCDYICDIDWEIFTEYWDELRRTELWKKENKNKKEE